MFKKIIFAVTAMAIALLLPFGCTLGDNESTGKQPDNSNLKQEIVNIYGKAVTVNYEEINGQKVVEGDIVLRDENLLASTRSVVDYNGRIWPNGYVYYEIDTALSATQQQNIRDAMSHYYNNSNIVFSSKSSSTANYVRFIQNTDGSGNPVGRSAANVGFCGGVQYVWCGTNCSRADMIHEMGHTVGLWHEQQRNDRNNYLNVSNLAHINEPINYDIQPNTLDINDFDFQSIMLYPSNGWMTTTSGAGFTPQYDHLSIGDLQGIAFLYGAYSNSIRLYNNSSYGDLKATLYTNRARYYTLTDLNKFSNNSFNDCISSLTVPRGFRVTLFEHDNFGGASKVFTGPASVSYVGDDFNDLTSSLLIEPITFTGVYTIRNKATGQYLEVTGGVANDWVFIHTKASSGTDAQRWRIVQRFNEYNNISSNLNTSKVVHVNGGNANTGTDIYLYADEYSWAQMWMFLPDGYGYFIISNLNNCVLDATGADHVDSTGTHVQLTTYSAVDSQKWYLTKVAD